MPSNHGQKQHPYTPPVTSSPDFLLTLKWANERQPILCEPYSGLGDELRIVEWLGASRRGVPNGHAEATRIIEISFN